MPLHRALAFCFLLSWTLPVFSQEPASGFPSKPVRMIVPYAAGGLPDTVARVVAQRAGEDMKQSFLVENRPGASGFVAIETLARSAPDGYTLMIADQAQLAINPALFKKLPYDPVRDFTAVSMLAISPLFLVAHASLPANSFAEMVVLARAKPGQLNYGSSGPGSIHQLATESLKAALGLDIVHVPYKGTGQSVPALVGGQVSLLFSAMPSIISHVKAGSVKVLATSGIRRSSQAPEVPTIAELGVPGYDFPAEIGVVAPAGTPPAIVGRLAEEFSKAVRHPDSARRMDALGIEPVGNTPQAYGAHIRASVEKYAQAVKLSGASASQ